MSKPPSTAENDATHDDADLLAELARVAAEVDPAPESAYELGRAAFSLGLDDELAELVADSSMESAGTRAAETELRLLSFESVSVGIDLQLSQGVAGVDILGILSAEEAEAAPERIALQTPGGDVDQAEVDEAGRFSFTGVTDSLIRFAIRLPTGVITTAWVRL